MNESVKYLLVAVNSAAMSVHIQVFVWMYFISLGEQTGSELLAWLSKEFHFHFVCSGIHGCI